MVKEVVKYYDALARDYHQRFGYDQENDLEEYNEIRHLISDMFVDCDVLEVACGTGYWTGKVSRIAKSVLATDINKSMISQARKLLSGHPNVTFKEADAYSLKSIPNHFTGAITVLWWCHIPRGKVAIFLDALHSKLKPGSRVLHICQLEDLDSENHRQDSDGNTIALRKADSRVYHIIKNIPSEHELRKALSRVARDLQYLRYPDFGLWSVAYSL